MMENPIDQYVKAIKHYCPAITESELKQITQGITVSKIKAKQFYIEAGALQQQMGYLCSGLIRAYYLNDEGDEVTVNFIKEGDYVTDYQSLKYGLPSKYYFQCLEPSIVINIPYHHLLACCEAIHHVEHYCRMVLEELFESHLKRIESFLYDNAEQRYLNFVKTNPELFNRISISNLSSYLGLERQSLTRIRKKLLLQDRE